MADAILRVVREARAVLNNEPLPVTATETAEDFVRSTSQIFRRPVNTASNARPKGRPKKRKWRASLFLVDRPISFLKEFKKLKLKHGFGPPAEGREVLIDRGWSIEELKAFVRKSFPNHPLDLVDFKFAKCIKGARQEINIIRPTSVAELAREIKAGKIYIIPMKQLPCTKDDNDPTNITVVSVDDDNLPSLRSDSPYRQIHESGTDESDSISVTKDDGDIPACSSTISTVCSKCHRTLNEGQCIHCRQDQEYQESLAIDKEKDRMSELKTLESNRKKEETRKEEDRIQQIRNMRKSRLPIEPTTGIKLKFRTNSSWNDFTRTFLPSDEVNVLLNFVGSLDEATEHFSITFPQCEPIESVFQSRTISDMGITSNTLGRVTWLTEPKVSTTEPETINQENNTLTTEEPTLSQPGTSHDHDDRIIRPQRRAASACNRRLHNWLTSNDSIISVESLDEVAVLPADIESGGTSADTYRNYMDVICLSDSNSGQEQESEEDLVLMEPQVSHESEDFLFSLSKLASTINKDQVTRFNIHRPSVWDCTIRKLKKKDFDPQNTLLVKFSDDFGQTEEGIDQGGPKREFLSLIVDYLMNSNLFEGQENAKTLAWNKSANDKDEYYYAGVMIALSLVHGGPAPHCFSQAFVEALENGPKGVVVSLDDLPDFELRSQFQKVLKAKTVSSFQKALEKISSFLDFAGIDYFSCKNAEDAEILIQKAVHSYLFDRTSQALERFKSGLKTLGVLENFGSLRKLFLYEKTMLNRTTFETLFTYCLSEEGSNDFQTETAIVSLWRDFLDDIEDGETELTFQSILMFTTGSKTIPPLGFDPCPSITFWKERLPKATTCTNTLVLPTLCNNYDSFVQNIKFGILNTQGFMLE